MSAGEKAASTDLIIVREKGMAALQETEDKGAITGTLPKLVTFHTPAKSKMLLKSQMVKLCQNENEVT